MIIDSHSHIWHGQRELIPNYLAGLAAAGIDASVVLVLETWAREVAPGNTWRGATNEETAEIVSEHKDHLIMFGAIPPQLDDSSDRLVELVRKLPIKGLKLHPAIQGFDPTNPQVVRFVRKAAELGLPMVIHAGNVGWVGRLAYNDPIYLDDLASNVPDAQIIVAHGGASELIPWIVKRHPNMRMDTAYAPNWPSLPPFHWKFQCVDEDIVEFLGPEKILFGTDMNPDIMAHPSQVRGRDDFSDLHDVAAIAAAAVDEIARLRISDAAKELILGGNLRELLSI